MNVTEAVLLAVWGVLFILLLLVIVRYQSLRHLEPIRSSTPELVIASTLTGYFYTLTNVAGAQLCELSYYALRIPLVGGCSAWLMLIGIQSVALTASYHLQRAKASIYTAPMETTGPMPHVRRLGLLKWLETHGHWLEPRYLYTFSTAFVLFWAVILTVVSVLITPPGVCWDVGSKLPLLVFAGVALLIFAGLAWGLVSVRENLGIRRHIFASMGIVVFQVIFYAVSGFLPTSVVKAADTTVNFLIITVFTYENMYRPCTHIRIPVDPRVSRGTIVGPSATSSKLSLERVLDDPRANQAFQRYLIKEFAVENILFWNACKLYRITYAAAEPAAKATFLETVYDTYLSPKAKMEINLTSKVRLETLNKIGAGSGTWTRSLAEKATPDALEQAERAIFLLMKVNFWDRFKNTSAPSIIALNMGFQESHTLASQSINGGSQRTV